MNVMEKFAIIAMPILRSMTTPFPQDASMALFQLAL